MKCSKCGCTVFHENELDKMNCGQGGVHEYMGKLYSRRKLEAENAKLRECLEIVVSKTKGYGDSWVCDLRQYLKEIEGE